MPRSITQIRWALPYCVSILCKNSRKVVLVRRVSRQHFIGERETVRRDDQCDHHLHAIAAFVAAVAVAALVVVVARGRGFEIGAGQVVEQNLELGAEQIRPALTQMGKQRLFVRQQLVVAAVERVLLRQREIRAQQVRHRALFKPLPVQTPLAAGIDQPVAHQRLQDVQPRSFLPARWQALCQKSSSCNCSQRSSASQQRPTAAGGEAQNPSGAPASLRAAPPATRDLPGTRRSKSSAQYLRRKLQAPCSAACWPPPISPK